MEHLKVNTLNENATTLLRNNLIKKSVPFKQLGTAFVFVNDNLKLYYLNIFKGLWLGANANMKIENVNYEYDLKDPIYIHKS